MAPAKLFQIFPDLPPEIRDHVWLAALDFDTPRVLVFHVDMRDEHMMAAMPPPPAPGMQMQLMPGRRLGRNDYPRWHFRGDTWERRWPDLTASTATLRALLATCRASRAVVLARHSPDRLPFGTVRLDDVRRSGKGGGDRDTVASDLFMNKDVTTVYGPDGSWDVERHRREVRRILSRPSEPTRYWMPYRADRDVVAVTVDSPWRERRVAEEFRRIASSWREDGQGSQGGGGSGEEEQPLPLLLESVQNLALYAGDCIRGCYEQGNEGNEDSWAAGQRPWDEPPATPCSCGRLDCPSCSRDPLPLFLATCCPRLKTLSFAVLDQSSSPTGRHVCTSRVHDGYKFELVPWCACPSGEEHSWPMVKMMTKGEQWCVWYPEEQRDCPFPPLQSLIDIRERWHPIWPRYESLRYFQFRILRRVEVENGKHKSIWEANETDDERI